MQQLENIQIILCNTSHPGNIGSAARAMKTMGIRHLTLVAPICEVDDHSLALAANAADIVLNAQSVATLDEALANSQFNYALTGRRREFNSQLQTPRQSIPEMLDAINHEQLVSIVFGNEQNGLTTNQLEKCNRMITIPGNPEYCSLNLAQAVQIVCYEIYSNYAPTITHLKNSKEYVSRNDIKRLLENFRLFINKIEFTKNEALTMRRLQHILHKAHLEREEADLLHGILKFANKTVIKDKSYGNN